MKKLLISTFAVATMVLTGVVTVIPAINNYQVYAAPTPAESWKNNHATLLAKSVDQITLTDGADIVAALEGYDNLSDADKATVATEYAHLQQLNYQYQKLKFLDDHALILSKSVDQMDIGLDLNLQAARSAYNNLADPVKAKLKNEKALLDKLNIRVDELFWEQNHQAILGKTEADVVAADWTDISDAFEAYDTDLLDEYNFEDLEYANSKLDHLAKLTKKIASPEAVALANKYDYFVKMPLDKVTVDQVVDYYYMQEEVQALTDVPKFSLMVYRSHPRIRKAEQLKDVKFNDAIQSTDAKGDAKSEFLLALTPNLPGFDNLTANKVNPKDSQANKLKGIKLKDVIWSRDIKLLNSSGNALSQPAGPVRVYLKINDQKVINLLKANKLEMVHVHKKADGNFETAKTPIAFNERYNVLAFSANKFSEFALVIKDETNLPNTGLKMNTISAAAAFGLLITLATTVIIKK